MKFKTILSLILAFFIASVHATSPTESLTTAVNRLLSVAANKSADELSKKQALSDILSDEIDFENLSKRIVSKHWKKATEEQKMQFKSLFLVIMTDTYFNLLGNYNNETVLFKKEQIKKTKKNTYAIVDTQIITSDKKIPVRYRMIKKGELWKIYDFIPEGISIVSTYKNNYSKILKKKGVHGLLQEMSSNQSDIKE